MWRSINTITRHPHAAFISSFYSHAAFMTSDTKTLKHIYVGRISNTSPTITHCHTKHVSPLLTNVGIKSIYQTSYDLKMLLMSDTCRGEFSCFFFCIFNLYIKKKNLSGKPENMKRIQKYHKRFFLHLSEV